MNSPNPERIVTRAIYELLAEHGVKYSVLPIPGSARSGKIDLAVAGEAWTLCLSLERDA